MAQKLTGLFAATLTPMHSDGSLDLQQVPKLVGHLKKAGLAGIYICGSTGEGVSLTTEERMEVTEAFVDAAGGELVVVAQVGHNSIRESIRLATHAWKTGVDVISANAPSYYHITRIELLVESMAEIASATPDAPFYYYHIPSLTGASFDIPVFMEQAASAIPNLAGLKYTAPLIHEFQLVKNADGGKFDVLWGTDEMLLSALAVGAKGAIGSTYNVKASLDNKIVKAFEVGDIATAADLQYQAARFIKSVVAFPFMASMKSILTRQGIACGPCRRPLENLTPQQEKDLHQMLDREGFSEWLFADSENKSVVPGRPHADFSDTRENVSTKTVS